ncbi:alpha/beta hydrolase [Gordonia sp. HY002]|uniref:alpha/beta hydrolase n=1 Tax=Gordonia zhenghanii TaxID=2911516 RepID=UPI001EF0E7FD|nr:alpha/beta hydrolase [Gordonia zhenghanii]MCF8570159.1 alpha/beta hydrolase [Gordonia zhenghanii]MCF8606730.1 alpha/beta hydrolase [Gordonia zhenghanii]
MSLDEATAAFLAQAAEGGGKPLYEMTPDEVRAMNDGFIELYGPGPDMASVENLTVAAGDGHQIPVRVLAPSENPRGVLVYYHGGGWVVGSPDQFDTLARQLAAGTGCTVVLPDYRLAPENVYPTAANDAWDVLTWTAERFAGLPLIVGGDSSGGNLAAVVAQQAVREGGPDVSFQALVYPVADSDTENATYLDPANQLMLDKKAMDWFWELYTPDPTTRSNPNVSPLQGDVAGTPPAVIVIAEHDVLRGECEAYAAKLEAAGVPVQARTFSGQMHGFFQFVNILPGSAAGIAYVCDTVSAHLDSL